MKLNKLTKTELDLLSYTDLTEMILKEEKKSLNTPTIFKKICDLLEYSDEEFGDKIGDYYTSLTIDKRFVFKENNEWDLREKHAVELTLDDEEEIEDEEEIIEEEPEEEIEEENIEINDIDDIDDVDDDLGDDLTILSEDELEEELEN